MCQGDLGPSSVLTPFEEDAIDEKTRGNPSRAARIYANRVARLALALHDVILAVRANESLLPLQVTREANQAEMILEQESDAARRGLEAGEVA